MTESEFETFKGFTEDESLWFFVMHSEYCFGDDQEYYVQKANEMLAKYDWDAIVWHMDYDICEYLHLRIAPTDKIHFLLLYMCEHREKYGTDFEL